MQLRLFRSPELILGTAISVFAVFGMSFVILSADLSPHPCPSVCAMPLENISIEDQTNDL